MVVTIFKNKIRNTRGYVALLSVMLIAAVGVAIMLSVITAGVDASKGDLVVQQLGIARGMANSCAEEALQRIRETGLISGSGALTVGSGTCIYLITSSTSSNITIASTGNMGTITSKIKVVIATTTPGLTLSSWEEVAGF